MTALLNLAAIRSRHSLPAIVGASVKLIRAGREWKACCPLHQDRSPSFTIYESGERWHCFGCGAGGDVLDYLQRAHNIGLREAVAMLECLHEQSSDDRGAADRCEERQRC